MANNFQISTENDARKIVNDIQQDANDVFKEGTRIALKKVFSNLSKKISALLQEFKATGLSVEKGQKATGGNGFDNVSDKKKILSLALRSYALIQELRKKITGENLDYLLYVAGGKRSEPEMKIVKLEDMVPLISVLESTSRDLKLQISLASKKESGSTKQEQLKNIRGTDVETGLKNSINEYYQKVNQVYYEKLGDRIYPVQKENNKSFQAYLGLVKKKRENGAKEKILQELKNSNFAKTATGFSFEAATVAALRYAQAGKELDQQLLLDIYKEQMGSAPFYSGGDIALDTGELQKLAPTMKAVTSAQQKYQLQLKNLSGGFGAQLANFDTIIQSLILIKNIIDAKNLPEQKIEDLLKKYLFNPSVKKVSQVMDEALNEVDELVRKNIK